MVRSSFLIENAFIIFFKIFSVFAGRTLSESPPIMVAVFVIWAENPQIIKFVLNRSYICASIQKLLGPDDCLHSREHLSRISKHAGTFKKNTALALPYIARDWLCFLHPLFTTPPANSNNFAFLLHISYHFRSTYKKVIFNFIFLNIRTFFFFLFQIKTPFSFDIK